MLCQLQFCNYSKYYVNYLCKLHKIYEHRCYVNPIYCKKVFNFFIFYDIITIIKV